MPPVEIQWCDHSTVLLEYLRQLYEEGRFVDVGLECEGRQVKAHKAVISACSPYLEGLLKGNPARSHLIKFNGYSYNSLRAVIDFMYNGKVLVEQEQLAAFLKLGRALQVRGILDIAAQCEEAGLTTAEETKSNAQYSTTVQQSQKLQQQQQQLQQQQQTAASAAKSQSATETKKYAFMLDNKQQPAKKAVPQQQLIRKSNVAAGAEQAKVQQQQLQQQQQQQHQQQQHQQQQQQLQQQQQEQLQQEQQQQQHVQQPQLQAADGGDVDSNTIEELQQALASGQALLQTDGSAGGDTLQMMEGQCVVTGSGQTYVVVQEGDNISFVPAEMVQGELQAAVNGGQVMEGLDPVEQQLAQMEGQVLTNDGQSEGECPGSEAVQASSAGGAGMVVTTTDSSASHDGGHQMTAQEQMVSSSEAQQLDAGDDGQGAAGSDAGSALETMSVVESLVKLGEKQPNMGDEQDGGAEVGPDMPQLDGGSPSKEGGEGGSAEEGDEGAAEAAATGDGEAQQASASSSGSAATTTPTAAGGVGGSSTASPKRRSSSEWSPQGLNKKPKL